MATEKLKFKLELYATMWNTPPIAEVLIDDHSVIKKNITGTQDNPDVIEFEHELEEGKEYTLIINRTGKGKNETVLNERGDIIKDQLLHIKKIDIDQIDLYTLVYEGVYTPKYPEPWATQQRETGHDLQNSFKNVTVMGFNGTWRFKFTSPFYVWLLENLY